MSLKLNITTRGKVLAISVVVRQNVHLANPPLPLLLVVVVVVVVVLVVVPSQNNQEKGATQSKQTYIAHT